MRFCLHSEGTLMMETVDWLKYFRKTCSNIIGSSYICHYVTLLVLNAASLYYHHVSILIMIFKWYMLVLKMKYCHIWLVICFMFVMFVFVLFVVIWFMFVMFVFVLFVTIWSRTFWINQYNYIHYIKSKNYVQ